MALVNHNQQLNGHSARQGNANYVLYKMAAQPNASCNSSTAPLGSSSCIFYDTTKGNISADCQLGSPNCGGPGPFTGVLVDPNNTGTPAWTTTAGFDLATGLGSVNVQNLVKNWAGSTFTPTVTTLSISTPPPFTHGQSVPVNISVAANGGSGTPTGDVSLIAQTGGTGRGLDVFTLNSGSVNQATSNLTGGTYNLVAHYAGDGTFAGSDSAPVSVTVNPEPSKTLLSLVTFDPTTGQISNSNASTAPYGSPYILRIDVGNSALSLSNLCSPLSCPTGSINLTGDGAPLDAGTYKLNSKGIAEDLAIQLAGGVHNLQAQYSGDSSYQASTGTSTLTITPAPTSISAPIGTCCVPVGTPLVIPVTVTAQSNGAAPTGTVTLFQDGGSTPSGPPTALSPSSNSTSNTQSAQASVTVTIATSGSHNFKVQYSGDQNYAASSGVTNSVNAQFTPTITLSANPQTVTYPGQTTITAVLHTGHTSPAPTGLMQLFGLSGTNLSSPTVTNITDSDGTAALQLTQSYQPVISSNITAMFSGDSNYQQVSVSGFHITVNGGPDFSMAASPANLSVNRGQSATTTVTITELNGFTGPVSFSCGVQGAPVSCSVGPNPVTPVAGSTTATATVTINAMALASAGRKTTFELFSFVFAGLLLAGRPRKRRGSAALVLTVLVLLSVASISCGGGSGGGGGGNQPPPPQTATITLTGSGFALNQFSVTHAATITVTVQ
jgi:hypothetical protein